MEAPSAQQPLLAGNVALSFVIPSAAEGTALPRTLHGNVFNPEVEGSAVSFRA